jgi:hypothetical protein
MKRRKEVISRDTLARDGQDLANLVVVANDRNVEDTVEETDGTFLDRVDGAIEFLAIVELAVREAECRVRCGGGWCGWSSTCADDSWRSIVSGRVEHLEGGRGKGWMGGGRRPYPVHRTGAHDAGKGPSAREDRGAAIHDIVNESFYFRGVGQEDDIRVSNTGQRRPLTQRNR